MPQQPVRPDVNGHLERPPGRGPFPGVVVIHEVFGLNDDIRAHCRHFADAGYLALAPDLYSYGPTWRCLRQTFRALLRQEGRAFEDIEAARRVLADREDCTGKVGVIGFCMGGGFALLLAPRGGFAAAAPCYGFVPRDAERVLEGACPIVGSYGGKDRQLRGHAQRLDQVLSQLGVPHDVKEYPDAGHSFLNRHQGAIAVLGKVVGAGYHGPAAEDAWRRILAFFEEHVRAG